mgnify:CR=1 FL=1
MAEKRALETGPIVMMCDMAPYDPIADLQCSMISMPSRKPKKEKKPKKPREAEMPHCSCLDPGF